jgi:MFS family permease
MSAPQQEPTAFADLPRSLAPLGYRDFGLFWIGHTVSHTGKWIELTGAVWLVSELTSSLVLLGLLGIARALPAVALSPIAGVIADRVDQRRLLFATQGLGLVSSLALGVLIATGHVQLWHVYVQVTVQAAITAFDAVARLTLFPRLVSRSQIGNAVTLHATASRSSELIGPAIGGVAIASLGTAAPFFLNAATFTALMAALVVMHRLVRNQPHAGSSLRTELTDGLRHMIRQPILSGLLQLEIAFGLLQMNAVMITIVSLNILDTGPEGLGGLLSAPALGALVGVGLLLGVGQARRQGRFVMLCSFAYAGALIAFALARAYWIAFGVLVAVGLIDTLMTVTRQSIMQLAAPSGMRGRVMANMRTVTGGMSQLANTQSGILAAALGPAAAIAVAGGALALAATGLARGNRALWAFSRDATRHHEPAASVGMPPLPPPS